MSWTYLKCLTPSMVLSYCPFGGSSAFIPEALVLSAVLSVHTLNEKCPSQACFTGWGSVYGRAGSYSQAPPVAHKPGGSPLMWGLTFTQWLLLRNEDQSRLLGSLRSWAGCLYSFSLYAFGLRSSSNACSCLVLLCGIAEYACCSADPVAIWLPPHCGRFGYIGHHSHGAQHC